MEWEIWCMKIIFPIFHIDQGYNENRLIYWIRDLDFQNFLCLLLFKTKILIL